MNLPLLLASSGFVILFKWTALLALGWLAHWRLRNHHARWRVILWRNLLCFGLVLPLLQFVQIPGIKIPIGSDMDSASESANPASPATADNPTHPAVSMVHPTQTKVASSPTASRVNSRQLSSPPKQVSWASFLMATWFLGFVFGTIRLVKLQVQLSRLRKQTCQPTLELQRLAARLQIRLNIRREVAVQVSDTVSSPFVCGCSKPMVILPRALVHNLSPDEVSALLSHELAHLRQNDLVWCVAWRWMKAACWFHPLVWNIPAAHNLACEQEADRVASEKLPDPTSYARLLARLALRVLALPAVETRLSLNGSSQIAQRLNHLGQKGMAAWSWRHSAAGFSLAGLLFLLTAGCGFTKTSSVSTTAVEFKQVLVVVQDENGKPIEGATVLPDGFRVKGRHAADGYGWNKQLFGPPEKAVTDRDGKAHVKYPVVGIPEEKELTGKLVFSVSHPEFATVRPQEYSVDSPEPPIQMTHGIHLEVSGYVDSGRQPVPELVLNLNQEMINQDDWQTNGNGVYAFHKLSPGGHLLQLMGRLPSGEIVYSESFAFNTEKGKEYNFALEMKPGIRLEGRLDDQVPRPVKNGRVLISVRPKEFPAWNNYADVDDILKKYPNFRPWKSYRPIAEDGTFVFESVPPGGLDVVVHGDGFVSQNGPGFQQRISSELKPVPGFALPLAFPLVAPTTKIEVATEPTATLEITAKTKSGKPVAGATVHINPNVVRMNGILGDMRISSEAPFRALAPLPDVPYFATTDQNGFAVIRNVPAITGGMHVYHPQFQVPLQEPQGWRNRNIHMKFSPGTTNRFELTLEPKGKDFIGSN